MVCLYMKAELLQAHKLDKVFYNYEELLTFSNPTHVAIIDDGVPEDDTINKSDILLKKNIDIKQSLIQKTDVAGARKSGHGWECVKLITSFLREKTEISSLVSDGSYWSLLDGLKYCISTDDKPSIVSVSQMTSTNAYQNMYINYLDRNNIVWVTNLAKSVQYPAYFLHPKVFNSRFLNKMGNESFGDNVAVAIPFSAPDKPGLFDKDIKSVGILAGAPSWATALLSGAIAMVQSSFNITSQDAYGVIWETGDTVAGKLKFLNMSAAFEYLDK